MKRKVIDFGLVYRKIFLEFLIQQKARELQDKGDMFGRDYPFVMY